MQIWELVPIESTIPKVIPLPVLPKFAARPTHEHEVVVLVDVLANPDDVTHDDLEPCLLERLPTGSLTHRLAPTHLATGHGPKSHPRRTTSLHQQDRTFGNDDHADTNEGVFTHGDRRDA
jgi:hypothetical protein